jgi:hypothetical protein
MRFTAATAAEGAAAAEQVRKALVTCFRTRWLVQYDCMYCLQYGTALALLLLSKTNLLLHFGSVCASVLAISIPVLWLSIDCIEA